jgi:hypothetical protein
LTYVAAFWTSDARLPTRIAAKVNKAGTSAALTEAEATAQIAAIAADMKAHLTEHAAVMARVGSAVSHVKKTLAQAQRNGGLKWFNRAFHETRSRAKACGQPAMSYAQARARLRQVIVRRMLLGEHSGLGAEILPEILHLPDEAPPQDGAG